MAGLQDSSAELDALTESKPSTSEEKAALECAKLRIEIQNLKRWYLQPSFLAFSATGFSAIVAVVGALFAQANGFFQIRQTELENRRHDLVQQISAFELQKKSLAAQIEDLELRARPPTADWDFHDDKTYRYQTVVVELAVKERPDPLWGSTWHYTPEQVQTINKLIQKTDLTFKYVAFSDAFFGPVIKTPQELKRYEEFAKQLPSWSRTILSVNNNVTKSLGMKEFVQTPGRNEWHWEKLRNSDTQ